MSPREAERLHGLLNAALSALVAEGDDLVQADGERADDDEAPYRELGQVLASNRNRERVVRIAGLQGAIQRLALDPESFGLCTSCDEPIPERRLLLVPWCERCVACESQREGLVAPRRKVTDYS